MSLRRLRIGELLALAGAICLIVAFTRPWYENATGQLDAWDTFGAAVVLLLAAVCAALALVVSTVTERSTALPVSSARGSRSRAPSRSSPGPGSRCATNAPRCTSRPRPSRGGRRRRRRESPRLRMPPVIDRDEVLHVARLARLRLAEDEIEPLARELSAVLDHIAKISELDLDDVPPTSHVVEVTGALRADEPRPSLPREVALAPAPAVSADGFSVPSPQA
jgi:aspartyl-tRNA(Asn)/glutamyl-tRNA(Gln) amidotransferase subunit C